MNNTDKVYTDLLEDIVENGTKKMDRTNVGTTSVFGRMVKFDMKEGFPLLTTKKVWTPGVIHELLWFLNGDTNIKYLVDNGVNIWNEWPYEAYLEAYNQLDNRESDAEPLSQTEFIEYIKENDETPLGDLGPVYGKQWVDWGGDTESRKATDEERKDGHLEYCMTKGINQIQYIIDRLTNSPDCRRIMVNAWNVGELDQMALMPCHYGFQFWTRELTLLERAHISFEKDGVAFSTDFGHEPYDDNDIPTRGISLSWNQRSCDTFLGIPFNIASYGLLLHMIAQQVNMVPLELTGMLGDCHIYSNHMEQVETQLSREPRSLPKLKLNKADDIFSYKYEDFKFEGYDPHPGIKAPIAV